MQMVQVNQPDNMTQVDAATGRYNGSDYNSTFMGYKEVDQTKNAIGEQNTVRV